MITLEIVLNSKPKSMKNFLLYFLIVITTSGFAQTIKKDSISIVKPDADNEIIDPSIFKNLEQFYDKDDAIVYIYRLSSFVGAITKWSVNVDYKDVTRLGQKEYVIIHINTTVKFHNFSFPDMSYNYTNFKPNKYYYIMLRGFNMRTGYLNSNALNELKSCKLSKSVTK
jgi:hypothetical protein